MRAATKETRSWTTDSRRWAQYKPRAGDVVIATSAKCGTTWMQQIVSLLIFQSPQPRPIQTLSPWIDMRVAPITEVVAEIEAQTHRRFLKAHIASDALPLYDDVRYIHVGRDGRDAFMSWHNHCRGYTQFALAVSDAIGMADETIGRPLPRIPESPQAFFQDWIAEGPDARLRDDFPCTRLFEIARSFWADRKLPNLLMVHYNDLKTDLEGEMRRIAAYLDIAVPEATWPALVEAAGFETMKRNGATLMPRAVAAWDHGHERFLNKGTNARWREALSQADVARYEARAASELSPALARWLAQGRLLAGDPRMAAD